MHLRTLLTRLIGVGLLPTLLIACGGPPPPEIDSVTSLPGDRQLLLGAAVSNSERDYELLLLKPGDPTLRAWELQGGRGLTEDDSSCQSSEDAQVWDTASRTLTVTGCFGEQGGLNIISAEGLVSNLARTILLPELDPITRSSTKSILRDGAVELPSGVEYPKHFRHARHSDTFAFTGYIWGGTVGDVQHYLYVVDPENRVTTYGEGWTFSEIEHIRWAPDDSALSFIASTRTDETFYKRAYYLDLDSGVVEELSDANVLIDSTVEFTSDGGVIFAGTPADEGGAPAIYFAAPGGAGATPLVSLAAIPQSESWRGGFLLSPDETRVAFEAQRNNPTTPWTLYSADLSSGAIRDLLPPDLQVQRSGTAEGADSPYPSLLAWHPEGQGIVFASSLTGHCNNFNAGGVVNCTQQIYSVAAGGAPAYLSEAHLTTVGFAVWVE